MTLQLCVSPCALTAARTIARHRSSTPCNSSDDSVPEPPELPEDEDWDEFELPDDDVFFDFCEIDDAPEPQPGDYWDDSLDGEWDLARCAGMPNDETRTTNQIRMTNNERRKAQPMRRVVRHSGFVIDSSFGNSSFVISPET